MSQRSKLSAPWQPLLLLWALAGCAGVARGRVLLADSPELYIVHVNGAEHEVIMGLAAA